jgi:RNA polymerase sigma factor (sigma-70 family)
MIDGSMIDPLREYVRTRSSEVFKSLVETHVDAVYSQCLRQLRDPAAAEDVTQQVFITLAQKAAKIPPQSVLNGWLFTATRYCCANFKRAAARRRSAERKAANMRNEAIEPTLVNDFRSQAEPILDDAIAQLGQSDRDAVLLRFFQGQSIREVGNTLGVSEDAAKQRVSRAVEKLRIYFARQGLTASQATVVAFLGETIKQAAPGVAHAAFQAAVGKSAAALTGHAAGLLSRATLTWAKIAAGLAAAGAITAAVAVASYSSSIQSPVPASPAAGITPILADASPPQSNIPTTQPMSQVTPLETFSKLCAAIEADDTATIDECLCDDGKDPATAAMGREFVEEAGAALRIENAWKGKFGVAMHVPNLGFDDFPKGDYATLYRGTLDAPGGPEVTIDGDLARMRVTPPPEAFSGPSGPNHHWSGAMLVFSRVDGNWKLNTDRTFNIIINLSREPGNDLSDVDIENKVMQGVNDTLNKVADQIEDGTIKSSGLAASAVQRQIMKVFRNAHVQGSGITVVPVIGG